MNLCQYGCEQQALFTLKNGKYCCSSSYNKCPAVRIKNASGVKKSYLNGRITSKDYPPEARYKMGSSGRGKTKFNCEHIKRNIDTYKKHLKEGKFIPVFLNRKHSRESIRKIREAAIDIVEKQCLNGAPIFPRVGKNEDSCFQILSELISYPIHRNIKIIGYFPDGVIPELKIIIEFDESFHFNTDGSYLQRDIDRQKDLEDEGYIFYRIKEHEWLSNRETIIDDFLGKWRNWKYA